MNPLFKLGEAGDSKDFIIFILEQIHRELKKRLNINNKPLDPLNQYDKANSFDHFFNEFKSDVSIISDVFYGIHETTNVCLNCKANYNSRNQNNPICYNYGIFNCLIFPLEEVKNMKLKNNMNQGNNQASMNSNNVVNIYDCFDYYQKSDLFTGDNKNYCNICKQTWDSNYITKIYSAPSTLILILNRGKNNCYDVKLNFTETIDITDFVTMKSSKLIYNLYGVITHYGESGPSAHFLAFCKSPINNKWYRYNDAMVTIVNNLQKDVIEFGNPYILFYKQQQQQQ
jgi:ubiquitin C-terminal hydrolase